MMKWRWLPVVVLGPMLFLGSPAQAEQYRLGRGDTLSLTVLGYPDLTRRTMINAAGEISLPYIGTLRVVGETLESVKQKLVARLAEAGVVRGAQATMEVVEYAPFYINGDVAKPGSYAFRPGITVRHAIALAGGYGLKQEGVSTADIWGQYRAAVLSALRAQARLIRLQAENADAGQVDFAGLTSAAADRSFLARLTELETEQFVKRRETRRRELSYLGNMLETTRTQLKNLEAQRVSEQQTVQELTEDVGRVKSLFSKRVVPVTRLSEAVQALAAVKARYYESAKQLAETRRLAMELERKAQRYEDAERLRLTTELQEAVVESEAARARLRAAQMKFDKARDPATSKSALDVAIRIFRHGDRLGVSAEEATELHSGDVLEVRFGNEEPVTSDLWRGREGGAE